METAVAIFGIIGALLVGAISPGPSFVLIARTSIALSRRDGIAAAIGMGVGGVLFGSLALLGLHTIFTHVVWLYIGFKLLGGLYLLYLACRLWRGATMPLVVSDTTKHKPTHLGKSFALAFVTQISNPKTAVIYGSIFAAFLPARLSVWEPPVLLLMIFLIETGWYATVACVLSSNRPRGVYLRAKAGIDRTAGAVMGALGIRLITEAFRPV